MKEKNFVSGIKDMFVPFLSWMGDIKNSGVLKADLIAGITVALVLVPQSMAYAQLAGLPPHIGLYASFIPVIIAVIWGSSRQLATGPVAVVSLMTAAALAPLAQGNEALYLSLAVTLAFLVGLFQVALGLFRLGILVAFLSHPVVLGFSSGAAIIIGTSQLNKLFGVTAEKGEHHYEFIYNTLQAAMTNTHMLTLGMGIFALLIMVLLKKYLPKIPNVLTAVVITTVLTWQLGLEAQGVKVVGSIPDGLPSLTFPNLDFSIVKELITTAAMIALIGFMEAISIAKVMAAQTRQRLDANQELVGQGLANVTSGFSGGYPVSGSFSRSAVNFSSDARTGYSSIVTGLIVGLTLLFLTPLLYHLPLATLASVILMAVINLIKIKEMKHAWTAHRNDGIVAFVTFGMTLVIAPHLEYAIFTGVLLSLGLYLFRTMYPRIVELSKHQDGTFRDAHEHDLQTCKDISVIRYDGSLYFGNAGYLEDKILDHLASKPDLRYVILDVEAVNEMDASGEEVLKQLTERLESMGIELLLARAKRSSIKMLDRTGYTKEFGTDRFFPTRTQAVRYATEQLGSDKMECSPLEKATPTAA